MTLLDGKQIATEIKTEIANEVRSFIDKGFPSTSCAVIVSEDKAAVTYIESIKRSCKEVGFTVSIYQNSPTITKSEFESIINFINNDDEIHGILFKCRYPNIFRPNRFLI